MHRPTPRALNGQTDHVNFTYEYIEDHYRENGEFYVQFNIRVVNNKAQAVSDVATVKLDTRSYCKFYESVTPIILSSTTRVSYIHSYIPKLMFIFYVLNV